MKIAKDKVVSLEYTLTVDEDTVIEDSFNTGPLRFIHGRGANSGVPQTLEDAVDGMEVGATKDVLVRAADMFPKDRQPMKEFARTEMPADVKVGAAFTAKTAEGAEVSFVVEEVAQEIVKVRFVHPLMGKDLNFAVKVLAVRDATPAELEQGAPMAPPAPPKK
ncbi:MAG TPA: FKBP-type peptidyl-prolyl cis-trans isomerase [Myxococcota bacterium]|jgi:FKBP-type peptidyl-prolyl cis-trans isomerase SlyD|nr:FKBP-type peptidyl-prolyl cis-trans isomerase [Myxococcota bacterium]